MFCSNCGNQILEGARFCTQCGEPVSGSSQSINANPENNGFFGKVSSQSGNGVPGNTAFQPCGGFFVGNYPFTLTRTMTEAANIAAQRYSGEWSYWDDFEIINPITMRRGKRYYSRSIDKIYKFAAKEDKRLQNGAQWVYVISPDGGIGMVGGDPDGSETDIGWLYVTELHDTDTLPKNIADIENPERA